MYRAVAVLVLALMSVRTLAAQSDPPASPASDQKGFTAYEQFSGTVNNSGHVLKLDSSAGYNFTSHFGIDVGLPLYFATLSATATTPETSNNGFGDPHLDLRLAFPSHAINYRSVITTYLPVPGTTAGLSTGRVTFDWTNHFDRTFSRLTPFLNAGVANTVPDSQLFERPFTSLGFNAHFEGGTTIAIARKISVGASAYSIVPSGEQKMYSKVLKPQTGGSTMSGSVQHGHVFETSSLAAGSSDLTRDHGFSTWIGATPHEYLELEVGYTRSIGYNLDCLAFGVGLNIGQVLKHHSR